MATVTTNLSVLSPVFLPPSSTRNPRRIHGINKTPPPRLSLPAKPFSSPLILIAAASSLSPLTPLLRTTRPSTLTWSTRSSRLPESTRSSTLTRLTRSRSVIALTRSPSVAELTRSSSVAELTRSLATLAALAMALARAFAHKLSLAAYTSAVRHSLQTGGTVFLASLREPPPGYLITPQTVVAIVLKKWLDIYSDVLVLRLLLSWFPNLPWERQPLSAVRELCDPYLNLFRDIVPPVFENDLNPHLALVVLGILRSILDVNMGI
ncbi:unnamed protein product [Eruca vesicaria subsp. sativa]|uniref:Uncharacterized protein n=1 Tax=Eruca vesicaria subsp. sativa TaxID=29727 RepID=A0ABC8KBP1_ERUVS|nr:unnamed protein product [Eruca vesicaria subsp. sativa]